MEKLHKAVMDDISNKNQKALAVSVAEFWQKVLTKIVISATLGDHKRRSPIK